MFSNSSRVTQPVRDRSWIWTLADRLQNPGLKKELTSEGLLAKSGPPPVFVAKALLEHIYTRLFMYYPRLLSCYSSSYDRNCRASLKMYYLTLYKESWSTLSLNHIDTLLSSDSLRIKEGNKLWLLRDTQSFHFQDLC